MDKRKASLSGLKMCRFCLSQHHSLGSLYDRSRTPKNGVPLSIQILSLVSLEVFPSDGMPSYICECCRFLMGISYQFKQICRMADETVMQYVQNGAVLEPVVWPSKLKQLFKETQSVKAKGNLKTIVTEEGACVEVTSQEQTDSEEDDDDEDGNVYNIKIQRDGSQQTEKANIKVVSGTSDKAKGKTVTKKQAGFTTGPKLMSHIVQSHASGPMYPCKYCNKKFIKSHHYTRHLRNKHKLSEGADADQYHCEQCNEAFATQDELFYHSAIHATQNLTCPLCKEQFEDVDAVTAHVKSHIGTEYMCDLCDLVFTSKERLDMHMESKHEDELRNDQDTSLDEDSTRMEDNDEEEDNISVKEDGDSLVVQLKKTQDFILRASGNTDDDDKTEEMETTYNDMPQLDSMEKTRVTPRRKSAAQSTPKQLVHTVKSTTVPVIVKTGHRSETVNILKKAEEMKSKTSPRVDSSSVPAGASEKSLKLLEKELQELKRTSSRGNGIETMKTVSKGDIIRGRVRPQVHTSTPKPKIIEEKKSLPPSKPVTVTTEKRSVERRPAVTKENKEPRDPKNNNNKDEKEPKEKDNKELVKSAPVAVKNGSTDDSGADDNVRRSNRSFKIKDYAKMARAESTDDDSDDDEEYCETEPRSRAKKGSIATKVVKKANSSSSPATTITPVTTTTPATAAPTIAAPPSSAGPKKRGRPRKDQKEVPTKIRKSEATESNEANEESDSTKDKPETEKKVAEEKILDTQSIPLPKLESPVKKQEIQSPKIGSSPTSTTTPSPVRVVQKSLPLPPLSSLKPVPMQSLPPGVKPLLLPSGTKPDICEMQIGKKLVKVQKIIMTKSEIEAMTKKGLVEVKDGTIVLKQGVKLPASGDPQAIKSTLIGNDG